MERYLAKIGLRELITEKYGKKGPATTTRSKNHKTVEGIWGTIGLSIKEGGYLQYHLGIKSDHRLIWIQIAISIALGSQISPSKPTAARKIILRHLKWQEKYISKFKLLVI